MARKTRGGAARRRNSRKWMRNVPRGIIPEEIKRSLRRRRRDG